MTALHFSANGGAHLSDPFDFASIGQTEDAQYKLDELVLVTEGAGRNKADGRPALQAPGVISFDDENGLYRMRAFNAGRFHETALQLGDDGQRLSWEFALGEIKTNTILRIDDNGRWTEQGELTIGGRSPVRFLELAVVSVDE